MGRKKINTEARVGRGVEKKSYDRRAPTVFKKAKELHNLHGTHILVYARYKEPRLWCSEDEVAVEVMHKLVEKFGHRLKRTERQPFAMKVPSQPVSLPTPDATPSKSPAVRPPPLQVDYPCLQQSTPFTLGSPPSAMSSDSVLKTPIAFKTLHTFGEPRAGSRSM